MAETETVTHRGINWSSALVAGLMATVVITVSMALFGTNIMKMLGSTMLGEDASVATQYMVGGGFHLMVGLIYGVLFGWLFGPVRAWNRLLKGIVYGLAITAIALATMPVMMAMMGGDGASNPCAAGNPCAAAENPCAAENPYGPEKAGAADNPCKPENPRAAENPCAAKNPCVAENPCAAENPCSPESHAAAANPCKPGNPCGEAGSKKAGNACSQAAGNPCNPCGGGGGGGGGPFEDMISLINHLLFALTLAFVYRPRTV